jgi:lambda repressor-like predicted transcriptional regulator
VRHARRWRPRLPIRAQYDAMCAMHKAGASMRAVARHFDVDHKTVDRALSRRRAPGAS